MKRKQPKPRDPNNHLMMAIRRSGAAGSHGKSRKAQRRNDKVQLRRELA